LSKQPNPVGSIYQCQASEERRCNRGYVPSAAVSIANLSFINKCEVLVITEARMNSRMAVTLDVFAEDGYLCLVPVNLVGVTFIEFVCDVVVTSVSNGHVLIVARC
jgi:hypothetical protein